MTRTKDLETLGLPPTASRRAAQEAYRALAFVHHPDRGGDAALFARIAQAYERLEFSLPTEEAPERCAECGGRGKILRRSGFHTMAVMCPACHGRKTT